MRSINIYKKSIISKMNRISFELMLFILLLSPNLKKFEIVLNKFSFDINE